MKNIRLRTYKDTGSILVDEGLIDHDRVEEAVSIQATTGNSLGRVLVDLGLISEWDLAKAVAKELGVPFIRLKEADVVSEATHRLDARTLHQHLFFVLDSFDGVDTVVVAEPPTLDLLTELTPVLGDKVYFVVSLISDVTRSLEQAVPVMAAESAAASVDRSAEDILRGFSDD